jgi:hypothetical protein
MQVHIARLISRMMASPCWCGPNGSKAQAVTGSCSAIGRLRSLRRLSSACRWSRGAGTLMPRPPPPMHGLCGVRMRRDRRASSGFRRVGVPASRIPMTAGGSQHGALSRRRRRCSTACDGCGRRPGRLPRAPSISMAAQSPGNPPFPSAPVGLGRRRMNSPESQVNLPDRSKLSEVRGPDLDREGQAPPQAPRPKPTRNCARSSGRDLMTRFWDLSISD